VNGKVTVADPAELKDNVRVEELRITNEVSSVLARYTGNW
jgi:hypothetical protein